jgi:hypothetical protein
MTPEEREAIECRLIETERHCDGGHRLWLQGDAAYWERLGVDDAKPRVHRRVGHIRNPSYRVRKMRTLWQQSAALSIWAEPN